MNETLHFAPKPEEEELQLKQRELRDLEVQLVERELQLIGVRRELAAFEKLYTERVGALYAELDELEAQIAELKAGRNPGDSEAERVAREARSHADESQASVTGIVIKGAKGFSPSASLKALYREVARRIHPDLAVDEIDRAKRQSLMAEANKAYENGDESRLRGILDDYESSPDTVTGEGTAAELVRVIRKIAQVKRRLAQIENETREITESDLSELKKRIDEGTVHGRDILEEMSSSINSHIGERRETLRTMRVSANK